MKILFLGAGASISAGYPPTARLVEELREKYSDDRTDTKKHWDKFESFLRTASPPLARLLRNPNPEGCNSREPAERVPGTFPFPRSTSMASTLSGCEFGSGSLTGGACCRPTTG